MNLITKSKYMHIREYLIKKFLFKSVYLNIELFDKEKEYFIHFELKYI